VSRAGAWGGLVVAIVALPAAAAVLRVPADHPTIAAALAAAGPGDEVVVSAGTWTERNLVLPSDVILRGATGDPRDVVIDAEDLGRIGFTDFGAGPGTELRHLTFRNGSTTSHGGGIYAKDVDLRVIDCRFEACRAGNWGGGLAFQGNCSPLVQDCTFQDNDALYGGGLYCESGSAVVTRCTFRNNHATHGGGGMQAWYPPSTPVVTSCVFDGNDCLSFSGGGFSVQYGTARLEGCTFHGNRAGVNGAGSAAHVNVGSLTLERCLVARNPGTGEPVACPGGATLDVSCCDVWGNAGGDWTGCLQGLEGAAGNFSADPLFCAPLEGDLRLRDGSPCAPGATACGLIGAEGVGCALPVAVGGSVRASSWGRVKAGNSLGTRSAPPRPAGGR